MKQKHNKGSLTVEATLSLIIFIYAFLTILTLCKFAKAQVVIQHAINQTAMEISKFSYITNKLGLKIDKTTGNNTIQETDKMIGEVANFIDVINNEEENIRDSVEDLEGTDTFYDDIKTSYENIEEASTSLIGSAKVYLDDPKALLKGFAAIANGEIADFAVSRYIASPLSKILVEKYLPKKNSDADEYLKGLGVDNGLDGLNFNTSTIFKDGSTINITVFYNMTIDFPLFPEKKLCSRLNASTIGWQSKLFFGDNDAGDNNQTNKSYINIWDYGGEKTTDEFIKIIKDERNTSIVRTPLSLDFFDSQSNEFTYVHSMNTELKSYSTDGILDIRQIKSKVKFYAKDAIKDLRKTKKITMEDGNQFQVNKNDKKCKVIIVIQESAVGDANKLDEIIEEVLRELNEDDLEIEFYYSDGILEVDNENKE